MKRLIALAIAGCMTGTPALAKDLSAESLAVVHDLMAPYRGAAPPSGPNADPAAVKQALDILSRERLVDFQRPRPQSTGAAAKLIRALALGQRGKQFLGDLSEVHDAIVRQDQAGAKSAIQSLYQKMGRARPEGKALEPLYQAALAAVGAEPQETESVSIDRPSYVVIIENARAAAEARVTVLMQEGPGGKPARVEFKGDVETRPAASGDDLELVVKPDPQPETMTTAQADDLRKRLNGKWVDQEGVPYEISGSGSNIVVSHLKAGQRRRDYVGTFNLGLIKARFAITKPDDMDGLPLGVREQLAGMGLHFDISLSAAERGVKLDGTWASQHVTYSTSGTVKRVHDPYDVKLVLTRETSLQIRFTDAEFSPLTEAKLYAIPGTAIGEGALWVEATAKKDDPGFDDSRVEQVMVTVTSDDDAVGKRVACIETAPGSRVFRSREPVRLIPILDEVRP